MLTAYLGTFIHFLYYLPVTDTPAECRGISLLPDMNSTDYLSI